MKEELVAKYHHLTFWYEAGPTGSQALGIESIINSTDGSGIGTVSRSCANRID
jgi:hypothetical protein